LSQERNTKTLEIDEASPREIVRLIQDEDRTVLEAVEAAAEKIAHAIEAISDRLSSGGRLFYVGAGTSGRIAMLDASELPPTYGTDSGLVSTIMAGGEEAYFRAVEGAEDSEEEAIAAVDSQVNPSDAVLGIAASGTTPFTVAAIRKANMIGALTIGISNVENAPLVRECDIPIVAVTGAEVIMGSTRMKAGTAQKLILNAISTGVMIRLGRVYSNLMVEMPATNVKLQRRAASMVELVSGAARADAERALAAGNGSIKVASIMLRLGIDADAAAEKLRAANGNLRRALEA
jgi:N-acetylmuramic acid 6-phosphate etherase